MSTPKFTSYLRICDRILDVELHKAERERHSRSARFCLIQPRCIPLRDLHVVMPDQSRFKT